MFIGSCLDAMDESITIGRLDQILQPYFEADIKKLPENEREEYIKGAIELVGSLFLRFTSHWWLLQLLLRGKIQVHQVLHQ